MNPEDVREFLEEIDKATAKAEALGKALNSADYQSAYANLERIRKSNADTARQQNEIISREYRLASIRNGNYARELEHGRRMAEMDRQAAAMQRQADLRARYGGRLGVAAYHAERVINSGVSNTVLNAGAGLGGMAMAGFTNTVEMNRLGVEVKLITRELAGAMLPAIELATKGLNVLRNVLEKLGPAGQNVLMTFMLLGMGRFAAGRLGLMGSAAASNVIPTMAAGAGGGLAPVVAGPAASVASSALAMPAAAGASRYARLGKFAVRASGIGTALAVANDTFIGGMGEQTEYNKWRKSGSSVFGASLAGLGSSITSWFAPEWTNDRIRSDARMRGLADPIGKSLGSDERRRVTPADASFDAVGSAYERIANSAAISAGGSNTVELTDLTAAIKDLTEYYKRNGLPAPVPAPTNPLTPEEQFERTRKRN